MTSNSNVVSENEMLLNSNNNQVAGTICPRNLS